jgi:thioredoxin 1
LSQVRKARSIAELTEIINSSTQTVIDFSKSQGCVYCKRLSPHFAKAAEKSDINFVEVDLLEVPDAINAYGIMAVPKVLYLRDGEPTVELTGRTSVTLLRQLAEINQ